MRQRLAFLFWFTFATCVHAQGVGGTGGIGGKGGVGGSGPSGGQFTLQQNVAGTTGCNANNKTCLVPITTVAGRLEVIVAISAQKVTISSFVPSCGNYIAIPGIDTNGITSTQSASMQIGVIYPSSSVACTNPTITFSGSTNDVAVQWFEFSCASGGCGISLDAYASTINTGAAGSPFNGQALTCTLPGTNGEVVIQYADAAGASGITAVASPYNTNFAAMTGNNFFAGGSSAVTGNTCPTPSWTAASNTSVVFGAISLAVNALPAKDWTLIDWHSGTVGNAPTNASVFADAIGYVGGGNTTGTPALQPNGISGTNMKYATDGTVPTVGSKRYLSSGVTAANSGTNVMAFTSSGTHPVTVNYLPPNTSTQISEGIWLFVPAVVATLTTGQWSMGQLSDGSKSHNILINQTLNGGGTNVIWHMECGGSDGGLLLSSTTTGWFWIARRMVAGPSGSFDAYIYASDGVTQLAHGTCSMAGSTGTAVTFTQGPGISGAEGQSGTSVFEWGPWLIDKSGNQLILLPGS